MTTEALKGSRWSDRRHASTAEITAVVVLVLQLSALVWGAAKLSSSVDSLTALSGELRRDVSGIQADMSSLKVDVGILKAQTKR